MEDNSVEDTKQRFKYPFKELSAIITWVEKIYVSLGYSQYHPKEDIAKEHELSPDSIKSYLSTAQQYGLLELKHRVGYKVTELFRKIYHPMNDKEKDFSIIESLKSPEIFGYLFSEYENHIVPHKHGISNQLIRVYNFNKSTADKVSEIFLNNLKDFSLINSRNVLLIGSGKTVLDSEPMQNNVPKIIEKPIEEVEPKIIEDDSLTLYEFPLTGEKKAKLYYPKHRMETEDFEIMVMALELIARTKKLNLSIKATDKNKGADNAPIN